MKNLMLLILFCLSIISAYSQVPDGINYQAIVRNSLGQALVKTPVSIKLTIHDGSVNGTVVYQEIKTITTNQVGLVATVIGSGGGLEVVNWSNSSKYLQVEIDQSGGSNFIDMGTTQLVSVPYALFSKDAASVKQAKTLLYLSH